MKYTPEQFVQALIAALPQGPAWAFGVAGTVQWAWVTALAAFLADAQEMVDDAPAQWWPDTTVTLLPDWEACLGLPDATSTNLASVAARRADVLLRLRGIPLHYEDSCPGALGLISGRLAAYGYGISLAYHLPFRCLARVGQPLGALDGVLWVTVTTVGAAYVARRCGDRVGYRLGRWQGIDGARLHALLERVLPARFSYSMSK